MKLLRPTVWEEMHLQENLFLTLDLGVKVTQNIAQYPLRHVTFTATKFKVAASNGLGGHTFTLMCQIKVHKLKKMHKFMGNLDIQFYS